MFNLLGRGPKYGGKRDTISVFFLENAMNSLTVHTALSEFINIR